MQKLRAACFGVSLDGFSAGPDQSLQNPLGVRGPELMEWFFPTRVCQRMAGRGFHNVGAWSLGRNVCGPVRGPWPDESWKGWWGDEPPYHVPVFVLTHHPRAPIQMKGGTTFNFVTDGIESALRQAMAAAGGKDVRLGGGTSTVRQYLSARLIDEMHLATRPVLLGEGENLWQGLDLPSLGYEVGEQILGERAAHVFIRKRA